MKKSRLAPGWYPLQIYQNKLSFEDWLVEIWKRCRLNDVLANGLLTQEDRTRIFNSIIVRNEISKIDGEPQILADLMAELGQPIKPISIFEVLQLATLITKSNWYQSHPHKEVLKGILNSLAQGKELNPTQLAIAKNLSDIPWHIVHENHGQENWYPKIQYSYGAPVTINAAYIREDIGDAVMKLLNDWGMTEKKRPLSHEIFDKWQEKQILAVFDLIVWFKINLIRYKKIDLANLLWPNPPKSKRNEKTTVDLHYRIDSAIELSIDVINNYTLRVLQQACENRKYQKQIIAEKQKINKLAQSL